jgi:carbamoyltransferase
LATPFERNVSVSIDDLGDFTSAAWDLAWGQSIPVGQRALFPHSLGVFHQSITQFLSFTEFGDEYELMGPAGHGKPEYARALADVTPFEPGDLCRLNLRYFHHHRFDTALHYAPGQPSQRAHYRPRLSEVLGPPRLSDEPLWEHHRAVTASTQAHFEIAFIALLRRLHNRYQVGAFTLSGGCAQKPPGNSRITRETSFTQIYVPPTTNDGSGALGAASDTAAQLPDAAPGFHMNHANWKPAFSAAQIRVALAEASALVTHHNIVVEELSQDGLMPPVADLLVAGAVVGWFQGRMEWGPRALGNRSIPCDPRLPDARERLNEKAKRREAFRPFAPSVPFDRASEWFDISDPSTNAFISQVLAAQARHGGLLQATTHGDASARVQCVRAHRNECFFTLLNAFGERTGVPVLVNTSIIENEPVVCTPSEALACFLRTGLDALAVGDHLLSRTFVGSK